jgi:glyoxylase-like metal-dependent hydrolase (beta-lactamase superfamily II)/rhodanese-related sulfurtransferase
VILKQYYLGCLAHASYLIGDEQTRAAVVVDPQRDIDQYLADAAAHELSIRHVFLTHFHADFVAGHLELRDRAGAEICLGARAHADYRFRAFRDGDALELGQVQLQVLETPGHTPEAICLLVFDRARGKPEPVAVLTGDTLFIGDVGRPDLMASPSASAAALAGSLYDSLRHKLLTLPDETLVYPAHGAGSMCGKNLSSDTVSTIGVQRRYNYALQPMTRDEFVELVTSDQPEAPSYFAFDAIMNRRERPTLEETLTRVLKPLGLEEVLAMQAASAEVLDVREAADFEGAHLAGAINVGLGGKFATWAGTVLDRSRPTVLIADPGREQEAAMRLGRIGFDQVAGYLQGGMATLAARPDLVRRTTRITAGVLANDLASSAGPAVLDVRSAREREECVIEGSLHIPLGQLQSRVGELVPNRPLVVHCASGYRSAIACSLLEREHFESVADLVGGMSAWTKVVPS